MRLQEPASRSGVWRRGCPKAWPVAWPVSWIQDEGRWGVGKRDCFSQTSTGNCLLIINVCSGINQYPSLPPITCWDLEQAIVLTWLSMYCPVALMWLSPTSPYIILWHLPSSTRIHLILQTPSTCFVHKFPLINSTNYQTGMVSLFLQSFPALCLQR